MPSHQVVHRYFRVWNTGDTTLALEVLDPNRTDHAHPEVEGPADVQRAVMQIRATRPGLRFHIDTILGGDDLLSVVGGVGQGSRPDTMDSHLIWRVRLADGRMAEMWTYRLDAARNIADPGCRLLSAVRLLPLMPERIVLSIRRIHDSLCLLVRSWRGRSAADRTAAHRRDARMPTGDSRPGSVAAEGFPGGYFDVTRSSRTTDSAVSRCASCSARRVTREARTSR